MVADTSHTQELVFAKLKNDWFIAGISLEHILKDVKIIAPEFSQEDIVVVKEKEIPQNYKWSLQKVKECTDWKATTGTYLLIENFENYGHAFSSYFPNA